MHDPNSLLSKEALQYCSIMEEKTGKPFYYFLFTYYKKNKPVCPKSVSYTQLDVYKRQLHN